MRQLTVCHPCVAVWRESSMQVNFISKEPYLASATEQREDQDLTGSRTPVGLTAMDEATPFPGTTSDVTTASLGL